MKGQIYFCTYISAVLCLQISHKAISVPLTITPLNYWDKE